jgi:outer membrane immunogenic protein
MKKVLQFLFLVLTFSSLTFGQESVKAQTSLGIFAGSSHFTVDQEVEIDGVELSYKTGLVAGALLGVGVNDVFSIQIEPMFLHKGSIADISGVGKAHIRASYFEIPAMLKFVVGQGSIRPYLMAGPSFGFLLSAKQTAPFIPSSAEDIKDKSETFEFGLSGGAGMEFPIGDTPATGFLQGRYRMDSMPDLG